MLHQKNFGIFWWSEACIRDLINYYVDTDTYTALLDFKTFMYFLHPIMINNGIFSADNLQACLQLLGQGLWLVRM